MKGRKNYRSDKYPVHTFKESIENICFRTGIDKQVVKTVLIEFLKEFKSAYMNCKIFQFGYIGSFAPHLTKKKYKLGKPFPFFTRIYSYNLTRNTKFRVETSPHMRHIRDINLANPDGSESNKPYYNKDYDPRR